TRPTGSQICSRLGYQFHACHGLDVADPDDPSSPDSLTHQTARARGPWPRLAPMLQLFRRKALVGHRMNQLSVEAIHTAVRRAAELHRASHDRIEHRLNVGRRAADHA